MTIKCFLAPSLCQETFFVPGGNVPANGAQLFFYVAGSNTKQIVYKDSTGSSAHPDPIVLDSGGNIPQGAAVWFPIGQVYKILYIDPDPQDPEVVGFEFAQWPYRCFSEHLFEPAVKPSATLGVLRNILRDVAREKEAV